MEMCKRMLMLTLAALHSVVRVCRFIPHLKQIIELVGEDSEWVDATRNPQLLDYPALQTLGFDFEGTTDVLVAERSAVRAHQPEKGARVLLDIRRTITGSEIVDAEARLVLANLHAPNEKPIMVRSANSLRAPKFCRGKRPRRPA